MITLEDIQNDSSRVDVRHEELQRIKGDCQMKTVTIMRGPSGSGKSGFIKSNRKGAFVVSADHYFMKIGKYECDPTKLALAHASCFSNFARALSVEKPDVVVDNTNIHLWEMEKYILTAELAGYEVKVIAFKPFTIKDIKMCALRNSHGVPIEVVAKMCYEYEDYPGETIYPIF